MQPHHVHLPLHGLRPRRLGRDTAIAAAVALGALFIAVGAQAIHATSQRAQPAVTTKNAATASTPLNVDIRHGVGSVVATVRGLEPDATISIRIVDDHGVMVTGAVLDHDGVRFDNLPSGDYRIEVSSEGPVVQVNDALISSAVAVRSELFPLTAPSAILVQSGWPTPGLSPRRYSPAVRRSDARFVSAI
jgi:hypothetical protein